MLKVNDFCTDGEGSSLFQVIAVDGPGMYLRHVGGGDAGWKSSRQLRKISCKRLRSILSYHERAVKTIKAGQDRYRKGFAL